MPAYSTSVVLENLEKEKQELEKFLVNNDGSRKYVEAKYKLQHVEKEIERVRALIDLSIDNKKIEKLDKNIDSKNEILNNYNITMDELKKAQEVAVTKIGKKLYQWKIDKISKKIAKLSKKLGKAQNKQRRCVNKKYIKVCKQRNKLAKNEAKHEFYRSLKSDLSKFASDMANKKLIGRPVSAVTSQVVLYSARKEGTLQTKIDKIKAKNNIIKFKNQDDISNLFITLFKSEKDIQNLSFEELEEYKKNLDFYIINNPENYAKLNDETRILLANQMQYIKDQEEYLNNSGKSMGGMAA